MLNVKDAINVKQHGRVLGRPDWTMDNWEQKAVEEIGEFEANYPRAKKAQLALWAHLLPHSPKSPDSYRSYIEIKIGDLGEDLLGNKIWIKIIS